MKTIIILFGPPGCGKGTQAELLADKFSYCHISAGELLRSLEKEGVEDPEEKKALADMEQGKMVPNWLTYRLVFRQINRCLMRSQGVILDGAIRQLDQAEEYQKYFDKENLKDEVVVVELALSDEEAYNRLTRRRMCENCGKIIPYLAETKDLKACPKCGGRLASRLDDDEATIKERITHQGNVALEPIRKFFQEHGTWHEVDGSKSIEEVHAQVLKILA